MHLLSFLVSQPDFTVLENGLSLNGGDIVTVGNASDVFVDIQCLGTSRFTWSIFPEPFPSTPIPTPLLPFETSYDSSSGLIRVFQAFILEFREQNGMLDLQCTTRSGVLPSGSASAVVGLRLCKL